MDVNSEALVYRAEGAGHYTGVDGTVLGEGK